MRREISASVKEQSVWRMHGAIHNKDEVGVRGREVMMGLMK